MISLDWKALQKKIDKKNVFPFVCNYPEQIRKAMTEHVLFRTRPAEMPAVSKVVFCGMGGSGIGGRIVKQIVSKEISAPIEIVSDYSLPGFVDSKTLVVVVSYSGNTEETLACFEEAKSKGAQIVIITNSGKLAEIAAQKMIVPKFPQPRMAVGALSVPIFFALEKYGLIPSKEKALSDCADFLEKESKAIEKEAQKTALKLKGKFPVIYAESRLAAVAYRFRCELNENSKLLALHHALPEMSHNEINAEILPKNSCLVFIRSKSEHAQMKKRFEFVKGVFKKFSQQEIWLEGNNAIEESYYGTFFFDMVSYYLALLNKKDPDEIPVIEGLKKALAK